MERFQPGDRLTMASVQRPEHISVTFDPMMTDFVVRCLACNSPVEHVDTTFEFVRRHYFCAMAVDDAATRYIELAAR